MVGMVRYSTEARQTVADLKYHRHKPLALNIAQVMAQLGAVFPLPDVLTWIPTTDNRKASRGFDHAELIARHLGALVSCPSRRLLRRTSTGHQTGHGRTTRLENVSFVASPMAVGRKIWVIDDVWTTGATLRAAASSLFVIGATTVVCVAYAHVS